MGTEPDELDDYDLFMAVLEDIDRHFALWLDSEIVSVTIHGWDGLAQFMLTEDGAMRLRCDAQSMRLLETATAAIMPDGEVHVTYPVDAKDGKI